MRVKDVPFEDYEYDAGQGVTIYDESRHGFDGRYTAGTAHQIFEVDPDRDVDELVAFVLSLEDTPNNEEGR